MITRDFLKAFISCSLLFSQQSCEPQSTMENRSYDLSWLLSQKYSPSHLFIDKIDSNDQIVPSQSLFDIEISHRLGFKVIELNVNRTKDDELICIHGVNGKFGRQVEHIDGITDISNVSISSVPLSYINENVRYRSVEKKYRTTIPTLERCCELCKELGMSVFLSLSGTGKLDKKAIDICSKWFGNNFIVGTYGDDHAYEIRKYFPGLISNWSPSVEVDKIEMVCERVGAPYIHCIQRSRYSEEVPDSVFKSIAATIHNHSCYAGFSAAYTEECLSQRLWECGFDIAGSLYNINEFGGGNICQLYSESNPNAFNTTGSLIDHSFFLQTSNTILPNFEFSSPSPFLSGGILKIRYSGTIKIQMGRINSTISSDGTRDLMFSTYFMSEKPAFRITAMTNTTVERISYQASIF